MGKGDRKSKKGKIRIGSHGKQHPKKHHKAVELLKPARKKPKKDEPPKDITPEKPVVKRRKRPEAPEV